MPGTQVARMAGRPGHTMAVNRLDALRRRGLIPWLIRAYGLPALYRAEDGALWADWRAVAHRFPRLARMWPKAEAGELSRIVDMSDRNLVNGALRAAVRWNLGGEHRLMMGLRNRTRAAEEEAFGLWHGWVAAAEFPPMEKRL